jgi:hypothetical protein
VPIRIRLPLVIGEEVRAKIERRRIYEDHLEEIVRETYYRTHFRNAADGGALLFGRDRGGRYLLVVLYPSHDYKGRHVVASARLTTDAERGLYNRHIGS